MLKASHFLIRILLEELAMIPWNIRFYPIFALELLQNLNLELSMIVEECTIGYLFMDRLRKNPNVRESQRIPLCLTRNTSLPPCNSIFVAMDKVHSAPGIHVPFSKKETGN